MRFIVPVPSIHARPNRKYFGSKRGVTWLNTNDQGSGLAAKVVSGTPGESLQMIDVIFSQDGGQRPDIVVADTGTYYVMWTPVRSRLAGIKTDLHARV